MPLWPTTRESWSGPQAEVVGQRGIRGVDAALAYHWRVAGVVGKRKW